MDLERAEKLGNISVSIVTIVAILCGGMFALFEYLDYKKESQRKNSLELVARYQQGEILKNRLKTDLAWEGIHGELIELFKKDTSKEAYENFVITVITKKELFAEVSSIMGLFEETVVCVNSGICDKETITNYFFTSGRSFFNKYYPYVCDQRTKWNDYTIWKRVQTYYNSQSIGKICSE